MRDAVQKGPVDDENLSQDRWTYPKLVGDVFSVFEKPEDPVDIWIHEDGDIRCVTCDIYLNPGLGQVQASISHAEEHVEMLGFLKRYGDAVHLKKKIAALKAFLARVHEYGSYAGYAFRNGDYIKIGDHYHEVVKTDDGRFKFPTR